MTTLRDFIEYQKHFDSTHESHFKWDDKISDANIEQLGFLLIGLIGEVGECSNIVKKIHRGDFTLEQMREELTEEIVDVFIYILKLIYQLNLDIETQYQRKMQKNKERFKKYETE